MKTIFTFVNPRHPWVVPHLRRSVSILINSQDLPLQRAKRASGRVGLTCGRASGAWIIGTHCAVVVVALLLVF